MKDILVNKCTDYCCANCGENNWQLAIAHRSDGKTQLIISCSDNRCTEARRQELHAEPDDTIIWEEFDISGQGYDPIDMMDDIDATDLN